jgi:ketosteroid isomerase-like protein
MSGEDEMANEEEKVAAAVERFYAAIEAMMTGKGLDAMNAAWHHTDRVTGGHPSGGWAEGWDELYATWQVFEAFGNEKLAGSKIEDLRVYLYGEDIAYSTCVFVASEAVGGEKMACTNVVHRVGGEWKIVHHHADKSPGMAAALEKIARGA